MKHFFTHGTFTDIDYNNTCLYLNHELNTQYNEIGGVPKNFN